MASNPDGSGRFWYRLSPETRAEVGRAYRQGATARALARKWMVSPTTIYRWAAQEGWGKRASGDRIAREHAREHDRAEAAAEAAAGAAAGAGAEAGAAGARARWGLELGAEAEGGDPDALGRAAIVASAAALKGGDPQGAAALAGLADRYFRLADRNRKVGAAPDLDLILRALRDQAFRTDLFRIHPDDPRPHPAKLAYWGLPATWRRG